MPSVGASLRPRSLRSRSRSFPPGTAFSDLAWRSSIRRMAAASISQSRQSSMVARGRGARRDEGIRKFRISRVNGSAPQAYAPNWYTDTMVAAPARPALTTDLDTEVCVVGGGLAGLTAAREIARGGMSVVLVEARRIAWNASGRNTGFVLPGFAQSMDVIARRIGTRAAKAL